MNKVIQKKIKMKTYIDSIRQQVQFSLRGSVTGDDGLGRSNVAFTSRSGKISIQPEYWFRAKAQTILHSSIGCSRVLYCVGR